MKRYDRIKLTLTRNWKFPGKERLSQWLSPSPQFNSKLSGGIVWLSDEDIAIYTTADNYIERNILSLGTYEDEINKVIRLSLKPGGVAIDIGANIGLQTLRMSQCVGTEGSVISFEPLEYLRKKFNRNIALNNVSNIQLLPFALSDVESTAEFKIDTHNWNQGTFNIAGSGEGNEVQTVEIKIADELPEIKALKRLDLIKIDVEGFEFNVLKGLTNTLGKHKPRIIFEYDENYWLANGQDMRKCYRFLQSFNYSVYQIYPACCQLINDPAEIEGGNLFCLQAE